MFISDIFQHNWLIKSKSKAIMHSNWLKKNLNPDLDSSHLNSKLNPQFSFTTNWSATVASLLTSLVLDAVRLQETQSALSAYFLCKRNHWYSLVVASSPPWFYFYQLLFFISGREKNLESKELTARTTKVRTQRGLSETDPISVCMKESLKNSLRFRILVTYRITYIVERQFEILVVTKWWQLRSLLCGSNEFSLKVWTSVNSVLGSEGKGFTQTVS